MRQALLGATVVVAVIGVVGSLHSGDLPGNGDNWSLGVVAVGYGWLGWLVAGRRPELPIGWLLLAGGVASALAFTANWWAADAVLVHPGALPGGPLAAWAATWLDALRMPLALIAPLVLFPSGRPRSARWRWFLIVLGGMIAALTAVALVAGVPAAVGPRPVSLIDAPGVDKHGWGGIAIGAESVARSLGLLGALVSFAGVAWARRRAAGEARRAYTTVLWGAAAVGVVFVVGALVGPLTAQRHQAPEALYSAATLCVPGAIAVAIARYRIYELRAAVSRSVLAGLVGAALAAVYLVVLAAAAAVSGSRAFSVAGVLAAGAVVLATTPVVTAGRHMTRRWFGRTAEATAVADRFSGGVSANTAGTEALGVLAEVLREELRLGSVELAIDGLPSVVVGGPDPPATIQPLEYGQRKIGEVIVTARPGEALARADRQMLADIAHYVAVAAEAIRTSDDLHHAQHALETAHSEERRRVRRDLHDGVAPTLASIRLKLTAFRRATADHGLDDVVDQVTDTIREVRRIVDGLQPSVLEDLGLLPALQILVADTRQAAGIGVALDAPTSLPELPADAANTAYRVVSEALANVMRHSHASRCTVRVALHNGTLDVEVRDDGRGFEPNGSGGMGLRNIATRAALANGSATISSTLGVGTTVTLRVPA